MARPRKEIDPKKVAKLAGYGCPPDEIAAEFDCGETTIKRRFGPLVKKGHIRFHNRLRSVLAAKAFAGDNSCLIFLAKSVLGLREHPDTTINVSATATGGIIQFSEESRKQLVDLAAEIRKRSFARSAPQRDVVPAGNGNGDQTALN